LESLSRLGFKVSDSDIDVYIFDKEGATKELKTYSSVEEVLSKVIERATQA
jgi:predicted nucleotidyltransferase